MMLFSSSHAFQRIQNNFRIFSNAVVSLSWAKGVQPLMVWWSSGTRPTASGKAVNSIWLSDYRHPRWFCRCSMACTGIGCVMPDEIILFIMLPRWCPSNASCCTKVHGVQHRLPLYNSNAFSIIISVSSSSYLLAPLLSWYITAPSPKARWLFRSGDQTEHGANRWPSSAKHHHSQPICRHWASCYRPNIPIHSSGLWKRIHSDGLLVDNHIYADHPNCSIPVRRLPLLCLHTRRETKYQN